MSDLTEQETLTLCNPQIAKEVKENIDYENIQVRGCVIGPSGAGKSALINSLCCLTGNNRALEGAMEKTYKCKTYTAAKGGYQISDIPGVGTESVPPATYVEKYQLQQYDFLVVLLTNPRLLEAAKLNTWAIELARTDLKKPTFLVFSKFDSFLAEFYAEKTQQDENAPFLRDLPDQKQRECITAAKRDLQARYKFTEKVFFVGRPLKPKTQSDKTHVFEFSSLVQNIANSQNARKRDVVIQNFTAFSNDWVETKKESLKSVMIALSIGSAVSGAIPIPGPGAAIDVGMLVGFGLRCKKVFCLEESDIKQNFSPEIAKLFIPRVAAIIATIGLSIAITSLDDAIKFVPVIGSIVGSVVGVVVSGPLMFATLVKVRNMFADLVKEMMLAEAKAQANVHYGVTEC